MTARTPRQYCYLLLAPAAIITTLIVFFDPPSGRSNDALRYSMLCSGLLGGLMFLWMGLRSKVRP